MAVTEALVRSALKSVMDPDLGIDIVTLGFVKQVTIEGGAVSMRIELTTPACPVKEQLKKQAEDVVARVPGVTRVTAEMTAQVKGSGRLPMAGDLAPGVKNFIAVGAGKGGVGKSTVAVNLAAALLEAGASVGILDADVYGPSIPKMLGNERRPGSPDGKAIHPNEAHGLKMMSMGLILDPDKPVVWRGPIVHTAIRQFLGDVIWGALDYLVIDLPPGTGDVPLTLAQTISVTGAVVVCTPRTSRCSTFARRSGCSASSRSRSSGWSRTCRSTPVRTAAPATTSSATAAPRPGRGRRAFPSWAPSRSTRRCGSGAMPGFRRSAIRTPPRPSSRRFARRRANSPARSAS